MLSRIMRKILGSITDIDFGLLRKDIDLINTINRVNQIQLTLQYRNLHLQGNLTESFDDIEFRGYSQGNEDGILLYIFSLIGVTNKRCIEICAGHGIQSNTAI